MSMSSVPPAPSRDNGRECEVDEHAERQEQIIRAGFPSINVPQIPLRLMCLPRFCKKTCHSSPGFSGTYLGVTAILAC